MHVRLPVLTLPIRITTLGINVILFFRCMGAFFNPVHRTKEGVKWGLAIHTTAMFSIVTVATAVGLYFQSLAYIDNREFTGSNVRPPGPMGAKYLVSDGFYAVPYIMFQVNQWLADGLLVGSTLHYPPRASNTGHSCSSIVVTSFME